ncbi:MAG: hypothetical protein JXM69_20150 [Anaerolineae bacterium]|nr:hypothetical protein [Anaerolineae bacterium]
MPTLEDAINVIRTGDREKGRELLEEILEIDESNEDVWLWLSSVVDTDEDREICLENVLALNPDNVVARKGLEALRSGTFNVHDIMSEAVEEMEETGVEAEDAYSEATFLDEFQLAEDADQEDDLEYPSTMKRARAVRKKGGLPVRIILLVVFVLCVVLALGGAAAYTYLTDGEGGAQSTQEQPGPAQSETTEVPPTSTPTPIPPTKTPFQLPTREPTGLPTPTATPVVSPTPLQGK